MKISNLFKPKQKFATATDHVKHILTTKGHINQLECLEVTGSWRLGDIVWRLRRQGLDITSTEKEVLTRYNMKTRVSTYHLNGK